MSIEVQRFLDEGNFTKNAPRPPVPGEENELHSNGGMSTRSSGSHKSQVSGKSHSSSKSNRSDASHSPAATPRRSNLGDKSGSFNSESKIVDDEEAPLGFEPEGSVSNSPPFTENSTPPYLKWAENLKYLLKDSDGVKLYKQFLEQEHCVAPVDFWFACQGLKLVPPSEDTKIQNLVKVIYRKYMRGDQLQISPEIKKAIADAIGKKEALCQSIFDAAQEEIEKVMRNDTYPLFLKSDIYVQYVQNGGESPKTSNTSSGSSSARPLSGPLPTLIEGEELRPEDCQKQGSKVAPLTRSMLMATSVSRSRPQPEASAGVYLRGDRHARKPLNPYHVSYAPVSAQDSELQSLSSDALTDDTMSLTDSSVDGVPAFGSKKWKRHHHRTIQRSAQQNRDTSLNHSFIPRTDRAAPKDRTIAETDPTKFAAMLTEKLEKVLHDQLLQERFTQTINRVEEPVDNDEDEDSRLMPPPPLPLKPAAQQQNAISTAALMAMAAIAERDQGEESAQSILEEHCSRIWDNSAGQTPNRHSPGSRSPDRAHRRLPTSLPGTLMHVKHHKRKEKDHMSTFSYDSGVGDDKSGVYYREMDSRYKHVHHYHHHHHVSKDRSKQQLEIEAQQRSMLCYEQSMHTRGVPGLAVPQNTALTQHWDDRGRSCDRRKSSSGKKVSDTSSNIDSGISMVYDKPPTITPSHPVATSNQNPNHEKVLEWMLRSEMICERTQNTDSDRSSSHKRSSHKSVPSANTPAQHRQSTKKMAAQYNNSRSGSLDRSGLHAVMPTECQDTSTLPGQPFIQDPSMPLMTPPNTTTQLEEAKRRLEDESNKARLLKSRSFNTGPISKDKRVNPPMTFNTPPRSLVPPRQSVVPPGASSESYEDNSNISGSSGTLKSESKRMKPKQPPQSVSAPATPAAGDVTIVGYYFCSEPIPYRSTVPGRTVTLAQFKNLITKKGNYRYFFKKACDMFDSGVVHEEVTDDNEILPLWEGKVVGKVEKIE